MHPMPALINKLPLELGLVMKACTSACTHTPVSSLLLIAVPKTLIFGLPFTAEMMLQTKWKVSSVHFSFKYKCRNLFCSIGFSVFEQSFSWVQKASVTKGTSVSIVIKLDAERHNWGVREHIMEKGQLDLRERQVRRAQWHSKGGRWRRWRRAMKSNVGRGQSNQSCSELLYQELLY